MKTLHRPLMVVNDTLWLATAFYCMATTEDNAIVTAIVVLTTAVYAFDLFLKFKVLNFKIRPFLNEHWLDLLFLIPFVKLMRGVRIFRSGRIVFNILRCVDSGSDLCEIGFRLKNAVKGSSKK